MHLCVSVPISFSFYLRLSLYPLPPLYPRSPPIPPYLFLSLSHSPTTPPSPTYTNTKQVRAIRPAKCAASPAALAFVSVATSVASSASRVAAGAKLRTPRKFRPYLQKEKRGENVRSINTLADLKKSTEV